MSDTLKPIERETIITLNEEDKMAYIWTYSAKWQNHLEKNLGLEPIMGNSFGGKDYEIDKNRIKLPRAPKKLSMEQRKAIGKRLQSAVISSKSTATAMKSRPEKKK